jgi:hypothetical protein
VGTALIRGKNGLTDRQKDGWMEMKKVTVAVRNYATRPKRTYWKSNVIEGILQITPPLSLRLWSAHIGDRNKINFRLLEIQC